MFNTQASLSFRPCSQVKTVHGFVNELWEAKRRNYLIVDEFWEEDSAGDTSLDERFEMKRFIQSVWANELNIDGLFLPDIASLGWSSRREHVTLTMLFELNDIVLITPDATYDPNEWMAGLSF